MNVVATHVRMVQVASIASMDTIATATMATMERIAKGPPDVKDTVDVVADANVNTCNISCPLTTTDIQIIRTK